MDIFFEKAKEIKEKIKQSLSTKELYEISNNDVEKLSELAYNSMCYMEISYINGMLMGKLSAFETFKK